MIHYPSMDIVDELLDEISLKLPPDVAALRKLKGMVSARRGLPFVRNDALLARYRQQLHEGQRNADDRLEKILRLNQIRSESGIATVTVLTQPYACPGRCVYCPTEVRAPKSYLTNEPAVRRAVRNDYDPYRQVQDRLQALYETGHPVDKIELIIKGGTWSFYPEAYQENFIQRCFEAANEFSTQHTAHSIQKEKSLEEVQQQNETAQCRMIGVTIETRPDYVSAEEISRLRWLGVTRVELGVQSLEEAVLHRIVRDHTTAEIRTATRLLKDAGFKVAYHLMPNLPGATPQSDLESARMLFSDPAYRPDALKLYPCVVIESAELYGWWKSGHYVPYDDATLIELLMDIKQLVPPYVRIERVIRDIPSPSILAGCVLTNLREEVIRRMRLRGLTCQCIRCRQVRQGHAGPFELNRRDYDASGGREIFLSFENKAHDLAALLRLRLPSAGQRQELSGSLHGISEAALVRELHTYGPHVPLSHHRKDAVQHQGFGQRLLEEAQRIARQQAFQRLAVISGVGAREYYRRFGFTLEQTYMIKPL